MEIRLTVNGNPAQADVEPRTLLVHFLRDQLRLTGTHFGCESSVCGACTVLLDGQAVKSCTVLAVQADGRAVTTVEGLAGKDELHPLQQAFWDCHALQCGFCTSGMLMTAIDLLQQNPNPSRDEIREALKGNLCRCTGYQHIILAIEAAARGTQPSHEEHPEPGTSPGLVQEVPQRNAPA